MFEELSRIYITSVSNSKAESGHLAQGGGCEFVVAKGRPQVWVWYEGGRGGFLVCALILVANCSGVTLSLSRFWLRNSGVKW